MTKQPTPVTGTVAAATPLDAAWAKVRAACAGFIGNVDALHFVQRSLVAALVDAQPGQPIVMAKTLLFTGPASVGKTHLANLVAGVLALPLVKIDGHGVRNREALFGLIDEALDAHGLAPQPGVSRSGIPTLVYPAFMAFVDEVHLVGPGTQQSWLTMLEQDDRSVNLDGKQGRRIALVGQATFIFATTQPTKMDRALRTRCTEIQLQRYTEAEVAQMVRKRFPQLPASPTYNVVDAIAACSRFVPRIAFEITRDILEEIKTSPADSAQACVKRALTGRGILTTGGMTRNDVRYLKVLHREGRPVGERVIRSQLHDVETQRISDEIEPYLVAMDYIAFSDRGRQLTYAGRRFLAEEAPKLNVE